SAAHAARAAGPPAPTPLAPGAPAPFDDEAT
ncbi:Sec-independent protein translocase TatB, partial [Cellulomonas triticagri]